MAGRKPKPTAVKELEGNPGKRKLNKKELKHIGVLTEVDMAAFAVYCQSYARWKEAQEHIDAEGSTFETEKGYQQQTPWVAGIRLEERKRRWIIHFIFCFMMSRIRR